jgi:hypothetical protein
MTLTASSDLDRHVGKFYGKYRGEVTDPKDPQQRGRVEVIVPSVFGPDIKVWATPCFASGHFFVPPVGTQVFVEFEAGDTNTPLWVGTWYPKDSPPDNAKNDEPDVRMVHTPSGHSLEFRDVDGSEKVVLRHKADSFVSIDEKGSVLIANNEGAFVYLNADSHETVVASKQGHLVSMNDKGITLVHHDGTRVEVKGGKVNVVGKSGVGITSGGSVNVSGSPILLGGSLALASPVIAQKFMPMYSTHFHVTAFGPTGPPIPPIVDAPDFLSVSSQGVKVTM